MIVLTWSDRKDGLQHAYERQLKAARIDYENTQGVFSWENKLAWQEQASRERGCQVVVLTDAWDVLLNAPDELKALEAQGFFNNRIVISGDAGCWPDVQLAGRFKTLSPWPYVCAGVMAGQGIQIANAIERGRELGLDAALDTGTDQRFWMKAYLEQAGKIDIDYDTRLVMSLSRTPKQAWRFKGGRLYNSFNGVAPGFVHFNGESKDRAGDVALALIEEIE